MVYGRDKFNRAIRYGSVILFIDKETGKRRIGHVWRGWDWDTESNEAKYNDEWSISFNHTFSSNRIYIEEGYNFRVIGNTEDNEDDEELFCHYWDGFY